MCLFECIYVFVCVEERKGRGGGGQTEGVHDSSREKRGRQIRGVLYCGLDDSKCVRWPASGLCVPTHNAPTHMYSYRCHRADKEARGGATQPWGVGKITEKQK